MARQNRKISRVAQVFRVLGDPSRLRIVACLLESEQNVTQVCKTLRMSQPTVSRHLSILKMSSLAEARREGKEIFYSIPAAQRRSLKSALERGESLVK